MIRIERPSLRARRASARAGRTASGRRFSSLAWAGVVGLGLSISTARGAEVAARLTPDTCEVGEQVGLTITVRNAEGVSTPRIGAVKTMSINSLGGPSESSQFTVINGRMESSKEVSWTYGVTPNREGRLTLPPITVQADGRDYQTQPLVLVVTRGQGGGELLLAEIEATQTEVFVEEPLRATLRVWVRVYRDSRQGLTLNAETLWSLLDRQQTTWGPFQPPHYTGVRTREDAESGSTSYYVFESEGQIWPEQAGPLDVSGVRVVLQYPQRFSGRDVFGRLRFERYRTISASPSKTTVVVKPIPDEGRPPGYNGAVGRYSISASASPTEAAVGDPITLTLRIEGTGRLERLGAPKLSELPDLARDFKIPEEPLAGRMDGSTKVFTQTIRATNTNVKQIPPIVIGYFNPQSGKFESAGSEPIPVKISAGSKLALSDVVEATPGKSRVARPLIERSDGLLANYWETHEVLEDQQAGFGVVAWLLAVAGPLGYFAAAFWMQRSTRLREDVAYRRRRQAAANARKTLSGAPQAGGAEAAARIGAALADYVADRSNSPSGALTRAEVNRVLSAAGVESSLVAEVDGVLGEVEMASYGGGSAAATEALVRRAERCVDELERASWR